MRAHQQALSAGDGQDVGEVLLALGVVRAHLGQRLAQDHGVEGIETGVDLADLQLRVGGVLLLDDAGNRTVGRAQDAAIARCVRQRGGDHGDGALAGGVRLEQSVQRLSGKQGHVPVGHQHRALEVCRQRIERTLGGPARARDLILVGDDGAGVDPGDVRGHEVTFVADHDGEVLRVDASCGSYRMAEERAPPDGVQDLGGGRPHPGALTCGEDDDSSRAERGHADALLRGRSRCGQAQAQARPLARQDRAALPRTCYLSPGGGSPASGGLAHFRPLCSLQAGF